MNIYRFGAVCNESAVVYALWERPESLYVRGRRQSRKPRYYLARETLGRGHEVDQKIVEEGDDVEFLAAQVPPGYKVLPGGEFLPKDSSPGMLRTWTAEVTDPRKFPLGSEVQILRSFPDRLVHHMIGTVQNHGAYMLQVRLDDWQHPAWVFPAEVEMIMGATILGTGRFARIVAPGVG